MSAALQSTGLASDRRMKVNRASTPLKGWDAVVTGVAGTVSDSSLVLRYMTAAGTAALATWSPVRGANAADCWSGPLSGE